MLPGCGCRVGEPVGVRVGGSWAYVGARKCVCLLPDPHGVRVSPFAATMLTWLDSPGGMLW